MNKAIHVVLNFERETKGAILYKNPRGNIGGVQNIYVRKEVMNGEYPNQIVVTIEAIDVAVGGDES